jgi:hypothetical protein
MPARRLSLLLAALAALPAARADDEPLPKGALVRLGTGRLRPALPCGAFALSPDGDTLATGEPGAVRLWSLASGKELRAVPLP